MNCVGEIGTTVFELLDEPFPLSELLPELSPEPPLWPDPELPPVELP